MARIGPNVKWAGPIIVTGEDEPGETPDIRDILLPTDVVIVKVREMCKNRMQCSLEPEKLVCDSFIAILQMGESTILSRHRSEKISINQRVSEIAGGEK